MRVEGGLVLEEDVDERAAIISRADRVQQVGVRVAQVVVDERPRGDGERREVQVREDVRREDEGELTPRDVGLTEGGLEEGVVHRAGNGKHAGCRHARRGYRGESAERGVAGPRSGVARTTCAR